MEENELHDEIKRRFAIGDNPTKISLWKWSNDEYVGLELTGTETCPYCLTHPGLCNECPFVVYGLLHSTCMDLDNPFTSNLRSNNRTAWRKSVYNYIYDIGLVQAKKDVLEDFETVKTIYPQAIDPEQYPDAFRKILSNAIVSKLEYYGITDYTFDFDDLPLDVSTEELIEYAFRRHRYEP